MKYLIEMPVDELVWRQGKHLLWVEYRAVLHWTIHSSDRYTDCSHGCRANLVTCHLATFHVSNVLACSIDGQQTN